MSVDTYKMMRQSSAAFPSGIFQGALQSAAAHRAGRSRLALLAGCHTGPGAVLGFSVVTNVMALAVPLYSIQVYDRVMASGSVETLVYLTLITVAALVFLGTLEIVRGRILQRIGVWLEQRLSTECLRRTLTMPPGTDSYGTQALRDVTQLRQTIGSPVVTALLDVARAHPDFQSSP